SGRQLLRERLRSDVRRARSFVRRPDPWPSMTPVVASMVQRDAEVVRLHRIIERVPPGSRVLDIGCGPGVVAGTLARHERLGAYLGVDLSEAKIASALDMSATNGYEDLLRFV